MSHARQVSLHHIRDIPTCKEIIQTIDGTPQLIKGVRTIQCTPSIKLSTILYVLTFLVHLISLSALVDQLDY
jgi:hypothetical protein